MLTVAETVIHHPDGTRHRFMTDNRNVHYLGLDHGVWRPIGRGGSHEQALMAWVKPGDKLDPIVLPARMQAEAG